MIGAGCSVSSLPCDILTPCQNNGTCKNDNITTNGYICTCPRGFDGEQCQLDNRPCKPTTCWNNGILPVRYSIINMIYFQVHAMRHRIQHSSARVPTVGEESFVKAW